jgi:hypothetical protein
LPLSAKGLGYQSNVSFRPSFAPPLQRRPYHRLYCSMSWQLSTIWVWDKTDPVDIGPLAVFLPVGLYGMVISYLSQLKLTAMARGIHGGFLSSRVDYVSGREPNLCCSLGSGGNVCTMPLPLLFNKSHLSALWWLPYTSP